MVETPKVPMEVGSREGIDTPSPIGVRSGEKEFLCGNNALPFLVSR